MGIASLNPSYDFRDREAPPQPSNANGEGAHHYRCSSRQAMTSDVIDLRRWISDYPVSRLNDGLIKEKPP